MTNCSKCGTKIASHLWLVEGIVYCSPRCERATRDTKSGKWTTKQHRYGDSKVKNFGVAGLVEKSRPRS